MKFEDTITKITLNDNGSLRSVSGRFIVKDLREHKLFTAIFDDGKPYSLIFDDLDSLKDELIKFYYRNKDSGYDFDCKIYNDLGEDITESQMITELVKDIVEE